MVQPSHQYMTTGKTITLTIWTFVGKVMSLLFNILSRFVIALWGGMLSYNCTRKLAENDKTQGFKYVQVTFRHQRTFMATLKKSHFW